MNATDFLKIKHYCAASTAIFITSMFVFLSSLSADSFQRLPRSLPEPVDRLYKVDPYIKAVVHLQSISKCEAEKELRSMAMDPKMNIQVTILCRMLFEKKEGYAFRSPKIGRCETLGGTSQADWLLLPIEIVDGVPFLVTTHRSGSGLPETSESYFQYCLNSCEWRKIKYSICTNEQKKNAAAKLIMSKKWKQMLTNEEILFLNRQIE